MKKNKSGLLALFVILTAIFMIVALSACDLVNDINKFFYGEEKKEEEIEDEETECEHNFVLSTNGLKPTCKQEGYDLFICSKCGQEQRRILEKVDHEYRNNVCRFCGISEPAAQTYREENAELLVYKSRNTSGDNAYTFVFNGNGTFHTTLWTKYLPELGIVRINGNIGLPDRAFYDATNLYEISMTGSVLSLGKEAFYGCNSMKSFVFPNGLVSIGDGAFKNCEELTDVTIPNTLTTMGRNVFSGCDRLRNLSMPFAGSNDREGADVAFGSIFGVGNAESYSQVYEDNDQKTYFSIPDSLRTVSLTGSSDILSYSFAHCAALIEKLSLSAEIKKIEEYAFFDNSGIEKIEFAEGSSLREIGEHAFDTCVELGGFCLPKGISVVNVNSFSRCRKLSEFVFEEGSVVSSIASDAFLSCTALKSISLPAALTMVETGAFKGCSSLEEIFVGENVVALGINSFADCSLKDVYIDSATIANTTSNNLSRLYGTGGGFNLWIEEHIEINPQSYVDVNYTCPNSQMSEEKGGKKYKYWEIK